MLRMSRVQLPAAHVFCRQLSGKASIASSLPQQDASDGYGVMKETNLCNAINDAMRVAMEADETVCVFGEDVGFGGVFRCTVDLQEQFGKVALPVTSFLIPCDATGFSADLVL